METTSAIGGLYGTTSVVLDLSRGQALYQIPKVDREGLMLNHPRFSPCSPGCVEYGFARPHRAKKEDISAESRYDYIRSVSDGARVVAHGRIPVRDLG